MAGGRRTVKMITIDYKTKKEGKFLYSFGENYLTFFSKEALSALLVQI